MTFVPRRNFFPDHWTVHVMFTRRVLPWCIQVLTPISLKRYQEPCTFGQLNGSIVELSEEEVG